MPIRVLPEQLASQIAAGEVVERPSSVVKELVENAIDAGASAIQIDVREGGRQLIQVADNGTGISSNELEMAFLRHATSKLDDAADLNAIRTLGFRGEALAAIAAVSQVTIVSRTAEEKGGTRLVLDGGRLISRESVGAPLGTVIAVENLFHNIPARLKFLKSVATEKRLIDELVTRFALAYPHTRFRLAHNNRITFQSNGTGDTLEVLADIYGPDTARQLLQLGSEERESDEDGAANLRGQEIGVTGFVGPPSLNFANRTRITLFVNGRWIKDSSLTYAVIQAYHTLLPTGRFPMGILFLSLPVDRVDVNVHPAKTEVRFRDQSAIFGGVQRAVRQRLIADAPVRGMGAWSMPPSNDVAFPGWEGALDERAFTRRDDHAQADLRLDWSGAMEAAEPRADAPPVTTLGGRQLPVMRVVGQVGSAYIITEGPDGLFLIDQHAAHERILYEQFMDAWEGRAVASQGLVAGAAVHLSPAQTSLLEENLETLSEIGFQMEPFGPNAFMVRAIPALLANQDPARALVAVVEDLERGEAPMQGRVEQKIILRVCKSAAVKAGQTLSVPEMEAMVRQLEACRSPHTCPHGRPTLIHLSVAQLAKEFGRF